MNKFMKGTLAFFFLVITLVTVVLLIPAFQTNSGSDIPPTPQPVPPEPGPGPGPSPEPEPEPEPGPGPVRPYEGSFPLVKLTNEHEKTLFKTEIIVPVHIPEKEIHTNTSVKNGSTETDVITLHPENSLLTLTASKYLENILNPKTKVQDHFKQYYVLTGFRQVYYTDTKEKVSIPLDSLTLEEVKDGNEGSINASCTTNYEIKYPEDLNQSHKNILLTQYIEPVYELHYFRSVEDFKYQLHYVNSTSDEVSANVFGETSKGAEQLKGIVNFTLTEDPSSPTEIRDLGFDLGADGSLEINFTISFDPAAFNNLMSISFELAVIKTYNIKRFVDVSCSDENGDVPVTTLSQGNYTVNLKQNTNFNIKLELEAVQ